MINAVTGLIPEWYTPVSEAETETNATRFELTPLNGSDFLEVMMNGDISADGSFVPNFKGRMIMIGRGLTNWENFGGVGAQGIEFSYDKIKMVPAGIQAEISSEIMNRSAMAAEAKKK